MVEGGRGNHWTSCPSGTWRRSFFCSSSCGSDSGVTSSAHIRRGCEARAGQGGRMSQSEGSGAEQSSSYESKSRRATNMGRDSWRSPTVTVQLACECTGRWSRVPNLMCVFPPSAGGVSRAVISIRVRVAQGMRGLRQGDSGCLWRPSSHLRLSALLSSTAPLGRGDWQRLGLIALLFSSFFY